MTQVSIATHLLASAVKAAVPITGKSVGMEVLKNVRLTAREDSLEVAATNLDVTITTSIPADVDGDPIAVLVHAKSLGALLATIKAETLDLRLIALEESREVEVVTESGRFKFPALQAEEYPALPEHPAEHALDAPTFVEGLQHVAFSASSDDSRPNLNGVLMTGGDGEVRMVTTDGHRLSLSTRGDAFPSFEPIILPREAVPAVVGVLSAGAARMGFMKNNVVFEAGGSRVFVRLIDLKFPDYAAVLPKAPAEACTVNRADLLTALKRTMLFVSDRTRAVRLEGCGGVFSIQAENSDLGNGAETVECDGDMLAITVNAAYIRDVLSALSVERVAFLATDARAALRIVPVDGGDDLYVIMPVRI